MSDPPSRAAERADRVEPAPRVAIIGAGIAGLTCAYHLRQLLPTAEITVVEASDHIGGKIRTTAIAGMVIDEAADAFLARVPVAIDLCDELGLHDQLVTPAIRKAFVYRGGRLHRFPEGLVLGVPTDLDALRDAGVVSAAGVERAAQDLTRGRDLPGTPPPGEDESVGALVRRRVGDEVMDALVGPLLSGVNAGDADALSVAGGAPQFAAAVAAQPSLIAGLRAQRDAAAGTTDPEAPIFYGLRGGTQTLTDALAAALPRGSIHAGAPATAITRAEDGRFAITVTGAGTPLIVDTVVVAVPTFVAAPLLSSVEPNPSAVWITEMTQLEWASVILVTFAVPRAAIDHALDGSGFLVAQDEGLLMTACSFGSSKWAHWTRGASAAAPGEDVVILRVSAGRHHDPRAWAMTDDEVVATLTDELATIIGLHGAPTEVRVSRWAQALPQYRPGHLDRARRWKAAAHDLGIHLIGAGYLGLGIPALVTDATATATTIAAELGP